MEKSPHEQVAVKRNGVPDNGTTANKTEARKAIATNGGIKKEYCKRRNRCKVTFRFSKDSGFDAKRVCIVGDFNNWDANADPMKKLKNRSYIITFELEPGKEYEYRYLVDGSVWERDWNADRYLKSPYGDNENSVIVV